MSAPLLSPAWFDLAAELLGDVPANTRGLASRMVFDVDGRRAVVDVADGQPLRITPGDGHDEVGADEGAALLFRLSSDLAWAIASGKADGITAHEGITAVEDEPTGRYEGPPSPVDMGERPEIDALLEIPGASVVIVYEYDHGPFGPVACRMEIVDGRIEGMDVGAPRSFDDADVTVGAAFRHIYGVRSGTMSILDAVMDGVTLDGVEGALALLAGISETPEFHEIEVHCGSSSLAFAALGEAVSTPAVAEALAKLREATTAPELEGDASDG